MLPIRWKFPQNKTIHSPKQNVRYIAHTSSLVQCGMGQSRFPGEHAREKAPPSRYAMLRK